MAISSIKILCQIDFPSKTIRFHDGSGPYVDGEGDIWRSCAIVDGLDVVEAAINGEAYTLNIALSGVDPAGSDLAYQETDDGDVIGSRVRIMTQDLDEFDQPVGTPVVEFTGKLDNIVFDDAVNEDQIVSTIMIECTNRFTLRSLINGGVLSDTDQRARAAILNPSAPPDRFAERVPTLSDKSIRWPVFT